MNIDSLREAYRRITEWAPNPGPQTNYFRCPAEIILYGGAKKGGKTTAGIFMCLRDWDKDGYRALIVRKSYSQLEREVIPAVRRLLRDVAKYNEKTHRWTIRTPDGGESTLEFGYLETEDDLENYQGAAFSRILIEESTQFRESEIRGMYLNLTSTVPGVKRQLLLNCNPIGPGFAWHKRMFIDGRRPGDVYTDVRWPSDGKPIGAPVCFIPATIYDNPPQMEADPDYPNRLRSQYGPITEALLHGKWVRPLYLAFDVDEDVHFIDPIPIPENCLRWMSIDWGSGAASKAACAWFAEHAGRVYVYRSDVRAGVEIVPYASELMRMCTGEKIEYCVLSHECFSNLGLGQANTRADLFSAVFGKAGISVTRSDKDPEGGLMLIREYLRTKPVEKTETVHDYAYWLEQIRLRGQEAVNEIGSLENLARSSVLPKLKIFNTCEDLTHDLPLMVVDRERGSVLAKGQQTDVIDALRYGLKAHTLRTGLAAKDIYPALTGFGVPETGWQAQQLWDQAQKMTGEGPGQEEPVKWPVHHRVG